MSGFPTDIEAALLPWLVERAEIEVDKRVDGRTVLDGIIREVLAARLNRGAQVSYAFSIFLCIYVTINSHQRVLTNFQSLV